jgi:VanZ family protein
MHKTSAWPLALTYAALVAYASLYSFTDWRDQGIAPWAYLLAPWPKYWTGFDVAANVLGYAPLGFLLALSSLRGLRQRRAGFALGAATLAGTALSLLMETLQSYLPSRVASNVDFGLNALGTLGGAAVACLLERVGALDRWSRFRARWFLPDARGALVLLALWPVALLFPASVPFGLGQVLERLETALAELLEDTPFLEWLPVRDVELQPLVPSAELLCVMLGALIPVLLGFGIIRARPRRAVFAVVMLGAGVGTTALSAALSYGPAHAWAWLSPAVQVGILTAAVACALAIPLPRRGCIALVLLALAVHLSLLNQAPTSAYFAQTLQTWEQGRFIRFHGLGQWLGWLWPYAALVYVLLRISRSEAPAAPKAL